jgi:DNA-binding NarL/FixJ family response regulator
LQQLPRDAPDVVLMDINLPGMSGIECVSRLKAALPDALVLMLTVYEDAESIFNALAAGASGYLLKRLEPAKLLEAIGEVVAGGSPMSASIARKVVHSFQQPLLTNRSRMSSASASIRSALISAGFMKNCRSAREQKRSPGT